MYIGRYSRYALSTATTDVAGRLFMLDRLRYRYRALSDNRQHVIATGDTLQNVAARYFAGLPDPAQFWWVVADFQPVPIIDPTAALVPGEYLVIPSVRTLVERVFDEARRDDPAEDEA